MYALAFENLATSSSYIDPFFVNEFEFQNYTFTQLGTQTATHILELLLSHDRSFAQIYVEYPLIVDMSKTTIFEMEILTIFFFWF